MKKRYLLPLFILLASPTVFAASTKDIEAQLAELKRINEAQAQNLATAVNQVQEMSAEFQKITGQLDQAMHLSEQQTKITQDNQRRLSLMEDKMQLLLQQIEELKKAGLLPPTAVKNLTDFRTYQSAVSKVNAEDYKGAVSSLRQFLGANPKSPYADFAQYWIAESFYAMRDFPASVAEFQKIIKDFPKSSKNPIAMLKQGMAFYEMQAFEDSKAFLGRVTAKFPGTPEAQSAQELVARINTVLEQKAKDNLEKKTTM